ncbi:MAG: hypothetical protein ACI3YH_03695 [Eubacteriales bacterium]
MRKPIQFLTVLLAGLLLAATLVTGCDSSIENEEGESKKAAKTTQATTSAGTAPDSSGVQSSEEQLQKFVAYIQSSEYANAIDLYNSQFVGNYALEMSAQDQIVELCNGINDKALADELTEKEVKNKLGVIEKVVSGTNVTPDGYREILKKIDGSLASKAAYSAAVDLEKLANYTDAIAQYKLVIEGDSNYSDARTAIERCTNQYKQNVFSQAETLASEKDYMGAVSLLKKAAQALPEESDIQAKITVYEKTYVSNALSEADAAFVTPAKDWETALGIINAALQYFPSDQGLKEKKSYYAEYAPVELNNLEVYLRDCTLTDSEKDIYGNNHRNVISTAFLQNYGCIIYILNGEYNTLTLTAYGNGNTYISNTDGSISVRDFSSGEYESSTYLFLMNDISSVAKPIEYEIDVTGVQIVRIWVGNNVNISDCVVQKTVK